MKALIGTLIGMVLGVTMTGCGITAPSSGEGVADLSSLDLSDNVNQTLSVSLGPLVLTTAARFVDGEAEKFLLSELDGVRVRHFEIDGDVNVVARRLRELSQQLQAQNWDPVLLVQEEDEQAHMLARISGETIHGLVVLVVDDKEAVVVNVMGELQPDLFTKALAALDVDVPSVTVARAL